MTYDELNSLFLNTTSAELHYRIFDQWKYVEQKYFIHKHTTKDEIADRVAQRLALGEYAPLGLNHKLTADEYNDALQAEEAYQKVLIEEIERG